MKNWKQFKKWCNIVRLSNTYIGSMSSVLPEASCGKFIIKKRIATEDDCRLEEERIKLSFNFRDTLQLKPGTYTYLCNEDDFIMSDTTGEIMTNLEFLYNAKGSILIGGLGLGVMELILSKMENIDSVLVIEKNIEVINLVWDKLKLPPKFAVVQADCFKYVPARLFDTIYLDIWSDISETALNEMLILKNKYFMYLEKNAWLDCWEQKLYAVKQEI